MGSNLSAHLAYGYDLGSEEDFNAAERSEYGSPRLPWYGESDDEQDDDEDDEREEEDFAEAVERILLAEIAGFTETDWQAEGHWERKRAAEARVGVEITHSGGHDYPGWMLVIKESERSCDWSEGMTLNLDRMGADPGELGWNDKLAAAIRVLGITPMREADDATGPRHKRTKEPVTAPSWIVYPSYG